MQLILLLWATTGASAFAPAFMTTRPSTTILFAASNNDEATDFAYQEMAGLLGAMVRQQVTSRYLTEKQRKEIENHVRTVARDRPSGIPLKQVDQVLPHSKWKLGFSTHSATLGDLPKDATVSLEFQDEGRLEYCLDFSEQTFGLNRLVAQSSYTVDATPLNPGLVTFVYENIVTDVFGFKGLGVGFFGLLQGRSNYIETVFMDQMYWIERGYTAATENGGGGEEYFNVYVKQFDNGGGEVAASTATAKTVNLQESSSSSPQPRVGLEDQWE